MTDTLTDIWHDRRVNIGYETAEELAKCYNRQNWRAHPENQRAATEDSLDTLGLIGQIKKSTVNNLMFDGHLRVELALLKNPQMLLPVDYYDLNDDETALALAVHDAITEQAEPIPDKLAALLERTREMTADRPGLGAMLQALKLKAGINGNGQSDNGNEPPMPTETEAERLAKQWETAPGQVWQLGRHIIACLDSTDEAAVRELIGGKPVGMVWADPPYGMGLDTDYSQMATWANKQVGGKYEGFRRKGGSSKPQTYDPVIGDSQPFDPSFLFERFGYVDELFLWGADYYAEKIPDRNKGAWLVWDKRSDSQGGNVDEMFGSAFELCWSKRPHKRDLIRVRWAGYFGTETQDIKRRVHPTQKPLQLPEQIFATHGKPEDLIFDPFLGSGISVLAAEKLNDGRRVIGCELAHEYIAVCLDRFFKMTGQTPRRVSG